MKRKALQFLRELIPEVVKWCRTLRWRKSLRLNQMWGHRKNRKENLQGKQEKLKAYRILLMEDRQLFWILPLKNNHEKHYLEY